ncbi:MAG TPA: LysR family transcriptional regulator [Dehalococcoidia bacterium]
MELGQLEAFVQVAAHRSFSKAAEALFLTQPSVTARIQALEKELGEELFERSGRSVRLTDSGAAFLPYAERALQLIQEGRDALEALRNAELGHLRLGAALTVSTYVLPRILRAFRSQYPGVEVTVSTGRSDQVLEMVLADEVHLGLVRALVHPEVETVPLYDDEVVLITGANHPFAAARSVTMEELGEQPLILYDRGSTYYDLTQSAFRDAGVVLKQAMELETLEAAKKMVEEGLGVALLPRVAVERELRLGILTEVPLADAPEMRRSITLIMRRNRRHPRSTASFVEVLRSLYRFDMPESLLARSGA